MIRCTATYFLVGSIMGRELRSESKAKIRIGETVSGCDETIDFDDRVCVCPAMDALFKVHDRVVVDDLTAEETPQVTVCLLVPSDQIIGKAGQIVGTMKDNHLPACALSTHELVQISGEASVVRKALFQLATRLHDNLSWSQHLLLSFWWFYYGWMQLPVHQYGFDSTGW